MYSDITKQQIDTRPDRLKSLFIIPYIALAMSVAVFAVYTLFFNNGHFLWIAALIGALGPVLFFSVVMIRGLLLPSTNLRTAPHVYSMTALTGIAAAITVSGAVFYRESPLSESLTAALASAAVFIGWLTYDYWYSSFGTRNGDILKRANLLPAFSLTGMDGSRIQSSELPEGKKLFIFFRGNWCPLCMAQIRQVASQYGELKSRGVETYLISPQSQKNTRELAGRFDVEMHFMTDPNLNAARTLGIAHEGGLPTGMQALGYQSDTVLPTVILTDSDGTIIYSDLTENYRIRPEPAEFLAELDAWEAQKQTRL